MKKYILLFILVICMISLIKADLGIYVKPLDSNNLTMGNTAFYYIFNFTTDINCSNVLLSYNTTIITLPDGTGYISINISSLNQRPNYLCVYRDGVLSVIPFSDLILNSLRVKDIYADTGNFTSVIANSFCYQNGTCVSMFSGGDNSTWNESYANTLYYSINNTNNYLNETTINNATLVRMGNFNCSSGQVLQNVTVNSSGIFGLCVAQTNGTDSWAGNYTFYYNASQIDNNFSLYYLNSNPNNYINITSISNDTIVRSGNYNCSTGQTLQNITINSSGIFGFCVNIASFSSNNTYNATYDTYVNANYTNKSNFWDDMDTINSTQMQNNGGTLNILESWLTSFINTFGFITDSVSNLLNYYNITYVYNKSEVDNNFSLYYLKSNPNNYVNTSNDSWSGNYTNYYNKSEIDNNLSLYYLNSNPNNYINVSSAGDNSSWNESYANSRYTNFSSFNSTQMNYSNGFINILESYLSSFINTIPNFINSIWSANNANNLLISNGTAIGYDESVLNSSVINIASIYNDTTFVLTRGYLLNGSNIWVNSISIGTNILGNGNVFDVYGNARIVGNLTVINGTLFYVTSNNTIVNGSIYPGEDGIFDLGNATLRWRNGSFAGTIVTSDILINGQRACLADETNCNFTRLNLYYLATNPNNYLNSTTINNATLVRMGNFNCSAGQVLQNVTINSSGIFGMCVSQTAVGTDSWSGNYTFYYNKTQIDNNFSLYYLKSNPNNYVNITTISNSTIVRTGNYNCSSGQTLQNVTINSSGIFGLCVNIASFSSNNTYNATYDAQIGRIDSLNSTIINSNASWLSTYNATYDAYVKNNISNSTTYWNGASSVNSTQMSVVNNILGITISWLNSVINTLINLNSNNFYNSTTLNNISQLNNTNNYLNSTTINNATLVRMGNFNCSSGQVLQNVTVNSSGIFGLCVAQTAVGTDSWSGNYTFYYNKTQIDNNFSLYYLNSNPSNFVNGSVCYQNGTGCNNYLNSTTINNSTIVRLGNFNCSSGQVLQNVTINSSGIFGFCVAQNINTDSWAGNYTSYYNKTQIDNNNWNSTYNATYAGLINNASYLSTYNATYDAYVNANFSNKSSNWVTSNNGTLSGINTTQMQNNGGTLNILESWLTSFINSFGFITNSVSNLLNYYNTTYVYNKSEVDNNLSLRYLATNPNNYWNNTNIVNSTIVRLGNFNCSSGQVLQNVTVNSSGIFGMCVAQTAVGTDSWAGNYTFYYNKTQIDNNFSLYYLNSNPKNYLNETTINNATIARAGSNTSTCPSGQVAQNITIVSNSSGIFITSWQCVAQTTGMNYTNIALTNATNNFTQNQIFSSNVNISGNISLGDSVVKRDGTNTEIGIASSGTVVEKLG